VTVPLVVDLRELYVGKVSLSHVTPSIPPERLVTFGHGYQVTEFEYTRAVLCSKYALRFACLWLVLCLCGRKHARKHARVGPDGVAGPTNAS
jgi:hypothetical protein